jgi:hypothetical protein
MWVFARGTHNGIRISGGIPSALIENEHFESLRLEPDQEGS